MRLPSKPTILMGRNHWSRCVGLTLSSTDRTASPQSSCMFYSQRPSQKKISKHKCLDTLVPNLPTADPKEARPGFHEPAKPGGDVSGEAFTTNGAEERQDEKCVCLRCPGICGNRELSGEGQTQQVRRQIRIVRPSNGDS